MVITVPIQMRLRSEKLMQLNDQQLQGYSMIGNMIRDVTFELTEDEIQGIYGDTNHFPLDEGWVQSRQREQLHELILLKLKEAESKHAETTIRQIVYEYYDVLQDPDQNRLLCPEESDLEFNYQTEIKFFYYYLIGY